MDGAGEEFFASAAFAEEEGGGIGGGDALSHFGCGLNRGIIADDAREAVAGGEFLAKKKIFAEEFLLFGATVDKNFEVVEIDGLLDEVEGAFLHGSDGFFDRAVGSDQNDREMCVDLAGLAQHVDAGIAGEFQVGNYEEIAASANFFDGGGTVGSFVDRVAGTLQKLAQHGAQFGLVFNE